MTRVSADSGKEWERHGRPFTPFRALIGGSGITQPGQSEQVGDQLSGGVIERLSRATLLNLECPDMYAAQISVILGVPTLLQVTAQGAEQDTPPLFARVSFGVGGSQTSIDIDWINGQLFSVPASFLRLEAALDFDQFAEPPPLGDMPRVNVPAMAGHLPVGQNRAPQRSRFLGDLAGGAASAVVPVPAFAQSLEATTTTFGAPLSIRQFADAAGTILLSDQAFTGLPLHLNNRTRYAAVVATGVPAAGVRIAAQLSV